MDAVTKTISSDGSCGYSLLYSDGDATFTVSILGLGNVWTLVETIQTTDGVAYLGTFAKDGVYKFTTGTYNLILIADCNKIACLAALAIKVACDADVCEIANFNSIMLLNQTYENMLVGHSNYTGQYAFSPSTLADELTTLGHLQTMLDRFTKYCTSVTDSTDCGCN